MKQFKLIVEFTSGRKDFFDTDDLEKITLLARFAMLADMAAVKRITIESYEEIEKAKIEAEKFGGPDE